MTSGVYVIVNNVNFKTYIGSSYRAEERIILHLKGKGSHRVANSIKHHGVDKFSGMILEEAERSQLPVREAFWMRVFVPEYNLIDLTETGGRIFSHTEETKRKIGAANKVKLQGHKQSDECKAKRSAKNKGRKMPPEHYQKLRNLFKGIKLSKEACLKMSLAKIGKKRTPEAIEKSRQGLINRFKEEGAREKQSEISRAVWAKMSKERKKEIAKRAWETRRRNMAQL